jgi:hypothetical protein
MAVANRDTESTNEKLFPLALKIRGAGHYHGVNAKRGQSGAGLVQCSSEEIKERIPGFSRPIACSECSQHSVSGSIMPFARWFL